MRVLVQRVSAANVVVNGTTTGAIGNGLLLLVGVTHDDSEAIEDRMADKIVKLRIFSDDAGLMNRSVLDVGGEILAVSQFTLYGVPSIQAAERTRPNETISRLKPGYLTCFRCSLIASGVTIKVRFSGTERF